MATEFVFAELIRDIQKELVLSQLQRESEGLPPLFQVKDLTLELQFTVEEDKDLDGKLGVKIIEAGASKTTSASSVHKMTIHFEAVEVKKTSRKRSSSRDGGSSGGGSGGGFDPLGRSISGKFPAPV